MRWTCLRRRNWRSRFNGVRIRNCRPKFTVLYVPSGCATRQGTSTRECSSASARTRFTRGSATALSRTAMAQEEGKAEGLNLVPVLLNVQQPCPPDQNANGTRNLTARGARAPAIAAAP
jgi:hypothetical protein